MPQWSACRIWNPYPHAIVCSSAHAPDLQLLTRTFKLSFHLFNGQTVLISRNIEYCYSHHISSKCTAITYFGGEHILHFGCSLLDYLQTSCKLMASRSIIFIANDSIPPTSSLFPLLYLFICFISGSAPVKLSLQISQLPVSPNKNLPQLLSPCSRPPDFPAASFS